MLEDLIFSIICFSCYLTLHDWEVSFYLILLVIAAVRETFNLFKYNIEAVLPLLLNIVFYWGAIWFVSLAYYKFETKAGGNRLMQDEMNYTEEEFLEKAGKKKLLKEKRTKDKKEKKKKKKESEDNTPEGDDENLPLG
mmetsp:Transcript_18568/g.13491  ORF Transcript_18568/g.13491 Transcript_18568/m.13491 type:complete len:138 (+) Transcript_18568:147-560(+)